MDNSGSRNLFFTEKELEYYINTEYLSENQIAKKIHCSISVVVKYIKLYGIEKRPVIKECEECGNEYEASRDKGAHLRRKFCSQRCTGKANPPDPNKRKDYQHRKILNRVMLCRVCKKQIPFKEDSMRRFYCSKECRQNAVNIRQAVQNREDIKWFDYFKRQIGCAFCNYNRHGGALEFHHINPKTKERVITGRHWICNSSLIKKEMKKCILICANCHREMHDLLRQDPKLYKARLGDVNIKEFQATTQKLCDRVIRDWREAHPGEESKPHKKWVTGKDVIENR